MDSIKLEELVHLLSFNSTAQAKKDVYTQIQIFLHKGISVLNFNDHLLPIIQKHLKQNIFVNEAITTWILYAQLSKSLPEELIKVVYYQRRDFDLLIPLFCDLLNENLLETDQLFFSVDNELNKQILNSLEKICDRVSFKLYLYFINNNVLKTIFSTRNDELRNLLIDFVLTKKSTFCISFCSNEEQKEIGNLLKNNYIRLIDELRRENNKNWYNLCTFAMKYCGRLLHSEIEIMNMILHNVEAGFKTKTVQDRLSSYECWKVLIDTCNLDHNYMCSNKQLRLLVKPLKVKLSKNDEVVQKRFEVWFYLAHLLQEKILYCLEEFLKFCFELQGENFITEMCISSDIIRNTYIQRNEVLGAIIGHYGHNGTCIQEYNFHFAHPIISSANFPEYEMLLINSVYVMSKMISKWDNDSNKRRKMKCMWGSIFKIIQGLNETSKECALHKVSKIMQCLLQDSTVNKNYFEDIMVPIFSLLSTFQEPICNALLLNEILIFPIIRFMLLQKQLDPLWTRETIALVHNVPKTGNKLFYFNRLCELLKTSPHANSTFSIHFWLRLAEDLYDICKMPRESFNDFGGDALFFLTWIFSCNGIEEMLDLVLCTWKKIFSEVCIISNTFGEDFLRSCAKLIGKSPECVTNLLSFLPDISQILLHCKMFKRYATQVFNVTCLCLQNPCIPKERVIMTIPIIKKGLSVGMTGDIETDGFISKIYECMEYLLRPHQVFEILEVFKEMLPKLSDNVKRKVPNSLMEVFSDLARNSDIIIAQDARFILDQLRIEDKKTEQPFVRPSVSTRSARIADMAKGNSLQTSPRGSLLKTLSIKKDAAEKKETRIKATPFRNNNNIGNIDDDSAEFVIVNKEVKVDKSKLSNHQKEMMNKRREDIPALYQDLSQSQHSNSTEASNSCGAGQNKLDLSINDNFKDIITDIKKKTAILHENFDVELNTSFESSHLKTNTSSDNNLTNTDFNLKFDKNKESEKSVEVEQKCDTDYKTQEQSYKNKSTEKTPNRNIPVFCSSKFEENDEKMEAAQAPIFPDYNLDTPGVASERSIKKKHKSHTPKRKLIGSRRMSDSHIILQKGVIDLCGLTDDEHCPEEDVLSSNSPGTVYKHIKLKNREFKTKMRDKHKKHVSSNKQFEEKGCESCAATSLCNSQGILKFKKKYRSLDNLSDIDEKLDMKKGKKCFKIIPSDVNNSIKLRISITEEVNDSEQDIIEQLDTEISKIDANLQNNSCFLNKKNENLNNNSESIFGSLDLMDYPEGSISMTNFVSDEDKNKMKVLTSVTSDNSQPYVTEQNQKDPCVTPTPEDNKKELIIQKRKQRELERIKMDIVGADEFLVTTPRKRRTPKSLESSFRSQTPTTNKQLNLSPSPNKFPKKKSIAEEESVIQVTQKMKIAKVVIDDNLKNNVTIKNHGAGTCINASKLNESGTRKRGSNKKQSAENHEAVLTNDSDVQPANQEIINRNFANQNEKNTKKKTNTKNVKKQPGRRSNAPLEQQTQITSDNENLNNNGLRTNGRRRSSRRELLAQFPQVELKLTPVKMSNEGNFEENLVQENHNNAVESKIENIAIQLDTVGNSELLENNKSLIKSEHIEQEVETHENASHEIDSCELQQNDDYTASESINNENQENSCPFIDGNREIIDKISYKDSDNFICEINGLVIDEFSSEASDNTTICESYIRNSNTENVDEKTISLNLGISETQIEKASIDVTLVTSVNDRKNCESIPTDSPGSEDKSIKDKYVLEDDINPEQGRTSDNETQSCDPYADIHNDEDVMEKIDKHYPGAVRAIIKDLNFDSLPLVFDTPKKGSIPCSPTCDDTPDRNKELLSNTSDISPIKVELVDSELLKDSKPLMIEKSCIKKVSSRSAKLLNLVPNSGDIVSAKVSQRSIKATRTEVSTPPAQRIQKMISNCDDLNTPKEKLDNLNDVPRDISRFDNVLMFTRELPSPFATPNSSILKKRKFTELESSASPYCKRRKRVNFSDPPTTSQKIYFMENEERSEKSEVSELSISLSSALKLVKEDSIYPKLTACAIDIKDVVDLLNQDLVKQFHSVNIRTVGDLAELNSNQISSLDFLGPSRVERITEVLDTIYSNYANQEKAAFSIYPDLMDCRDPIRNILKFVGSCHTVKEFRSNNITTVGDLATITKTEASQLSFKLPNILSALQKYRRKLNKSKILAKQKEEEMKADIESSSINVPNETEDNIGDSNVENLPKSTLKEHIQTEKLSNGATVNCNSKSGCSKKTVEEEVNYMKAMYNRDEMFAIFYHLKDILFTNK